MDLYGPPESRPHGGRPPPQRRPASEQRPHQQQPSVQDAANSSLASGPLPPDSLNVPALLAEGNKVADEAEWLRQKIAEQRLRARRRREDVQIRVNAAAHADSERLWGERAELEGKLAQQLRHIHGLEASSMDLSDKFSRQSARAKKLHHCLLKASRHVQAQGLGAAAAENPAAAGGDRSAAGGGRGGPQGNYGGGFDFPELGAMQGLARHFTWKMQEVDKEVQQAYTEKDRIEVEISNRRHAAALTEALHRARLDALGVPEASVSLGSGGGALAEGSLLTGEPSEILLASPASYQGSQMSP